MQHFTILQRIASPAPRRPKNVSVPLCVGSLDPKVFGRHLRIPIGGMVSAARERTSMPADVCPECRTILRTYCG